MFKWDKKSKKDKSPKIIKYDDNIKTNIKLQEVKTNTMRTKRKMAFNLQLLIPIVAAFVVAGLFIAFSSEIAGDIRDDMTANSLEYNATQDTMTGMGNISAKFPTLGTIIIAGVLLSTLVAFLVFKTKN